MSGFHPVPKPDPKVKHHKPLAKVNRKRKASEFVRCYGSKKRVQWIKSLPCAAHIVNCEGDIENAHINISGMGRKSAASNIVPLCHWHHDQLHRIGPRSFERFYHLDLPALAEETERAWLASNGGK